MFSLMSDLKNAAYFLAGWLYFFGKFFQAIAAGGSIQNAKVFASEVKKNQDLLIRFQEERETAENIERDWIRPMELMEKGDSPIDFDSLPEVEQACYKFRRSALTPELKNSLSRAFRLAIKLKARRA